MPRRNDDVPGGQAPSPDPNEPAQESTVPAAGDRDPEDEAAIVTVDPEFVAAAREVIGFWGMHKRSPTQYTAQIESAVQRMARYLPADS
jgi:hypothetical protein